MGARDVDRDGDAGGEAQRLRVGNERDVVVDRPDAARQLCRREVDVGRRRGRAGTMVDAHDRQGRCGDAAQAGAEAVRRQATPQESPHDGQRVAARHRLDEAREVGGRRVVGAVGDRAHDGARHAEVVADLRQRRAFHLDGERVGQARRSSAPSSARATKRSPLTTRPVCTRGAVIANGRRSSARSASAGSCGCVAAGALGRRVGEHRARGVGERVREARSQAKRSMP